MNLDNLQAQLQDNLITYLSDLPDSLIDGVCQVVVDTFKDNK